MMLLYLSCNSPGRDRTPSLAQSAWKAWNRREQEQWGTPPTDDSLPLAIANSMLRVKTCKKSLHGCIHAPSVSIFIIEWVHIPYINN